MVEQEKESIRERFQLSLERIVKILSEKEVPFPYQDYFRKMAAFFIMIEEYRVFMEAGGLKRASLEELQQWNTRLYQDIFPENYESSYANPAYAVSVLGEEHGPLLCYLYKEIRGAVVFACEDRLPARTILQEVLIEIYNLFEEEIPPAASVKEILYWFVSDYSGETVSYRIREGMDPDCSFAAHIVGESDFNDLRYLYYYGEYVSESVLKTAGFLNSLPEAKVRLMADTFTEGYKKGFAVMGRDLSKKSSVSIRYELGFERMVGYAVENFKAMGLQAVLCRQPVWTVNQTPGRKTGYYGPSPNRQYEYDHRYDQALFLNKAFKERKSAVMKAAYEEWKDLAAAYAGPAVIETFGREEFRPVNKPQALRLSPAQEKLSVELSGEGMRIQNQYIPGDEISFCLIAFPVTEIGADFEGIFEETVAINTLDYETYKEYQQKLIDALDQARYLEITGKGQNQTRLKVALGPLADKQKESNFENCVADVNIPLGEVFTSPRLSGTEGVLEVSAVYIGDFRFQDLRMVFENGMVTDYSCGNFDNPEEGRALIKQVILKNHDTLPMGEFAIGTNTAAYAMAKKYGIFHKLPILIAEKMGPHFAVGDTCYSWAEDSPVYNPDGKEIVARENEISAKRKEDLSKAYFNCHTDITLPYGELDKIAAITGEGREILLIEAGKFVLEGTQELNLPLNTY